MKDWTFNNKKIVEKFDDHVREQLPFYELISESIFFIVKNYLTENNIVIDIGSSTGNMIERLSDTLLQRNCKIIAIDKSEEMCKFLVNKYKSPYFNVINGDITEIEIPDAQVYILNLTIMFIPVDKREKFINNIFKKLKKGGCIIIVDKICDYNGYLATVMKRLTWFWKLNNNACPKEILNKEMSLVGVQIPILDTDIINGKEFFRLGEFAGWVIEKE